MQIPLPKINKGPNCIAHPFPIQVGLQTLEFIQASIFYSTISDFMSGEYLKIPKALEHLKDIMIEQGYQPEGWDQDWSYLSKYQDIFSNYVFQNVLIQIKSHWDWFIRNIEDFVIFSRENSSCKALSKDDQKNLNRLGNKFITIQLETIEKACDINLKIPKENLDLLTEMSLIRNLGIHNRWEVDQPYIDKTPINNNWKIGEIRQFDKTELFNWFKCFQQVIHEVSIEVGKRFYQVPDYFIK